MAGEKLTQIKVRNSNGNVIETVPISVSTDNIKYNDNISLEEKINSLQLDSKLNANLGVQHRGEFLFVQDNGDVAATHLNTTVIKNALEIPTALSGFTNDVGYITENKFADYSLSRTTISTLQSDINNRYTKTEIDSQISGVGDTITSEKNIIYQDINNIYSFMSDLQGFYKLESQNANLEDRERANTAKIILDNKADIESIKQNIESIIGSQTQTEQSTSGQIQQIRTDISNLQTIVNNTNASQFYYVENENRPTVAFAGRATDIRFWGNQDNKIGMHVLNDTDNKKYGLWARTGKRADGTGISHRGFVIYNYTDGLYEYSTTEFQKGQTVTLTNGQIYTGYFTNGRKSLKFYIPLGKSCRWCSKENIHLNWNASTPQVLVLRGVSGYVTNITSGNYKNFFDPRNTKTFTTTCYPKTNGVEVVIEYVNKSDFPNAVANTPVAVHLSGHDMYLTFGTRPSSGGSISGGTQNTPTKP